MFPAALGADAFTAISAMSPMAATVPIADSAQPAGDALLQIPGGLFGGGANSTEAYGSEAEPPERTWFADGWRRSCLASRCRAYCHSEPEKGPKMPDIVISEFMDGTAVARLSQAHETLYDPELVDRPAALARAVASARSLIVRNRTQVRGDLLDAGAQLACVGRLGVGLDNIDVEACRARSINVYPATGANDLAVAEYVITAALSLLRDAYCARHAVAAGTWPRQALVGRELSGKTMGLVGYGAIARETARRAAALGMRVVAFDPYLAPGAPDWGDTGQRGIDDLLTEADVVSLHVPLTDGTRHIISASALGQMKPDAVLINAARGGIVDEVALAAALRAKHLGGAALDVFEVEPLTAERGSMFAGLTNLILTPHIAGVTAESNVRVSHLIADKVLEHLSEET